MTKDPYRKSNVEGDRLEILMDKESRVDDGAVKWITGKLDSGGVCIII